MGNVTRLPNTLIMHDSTENIQPSEYDKLAKTLEIAMSNRNFEIDLFWRRSLFFWGFIAAAFVGYAALVKENPRLGCLLATLGLVSSTVWSLGNRGSKYWQEAWEQKVGRAELPVIGPLHQSVEPLKQGGQWLQARRFSVTKLTIALSDYITFTWLVILVGTMLNVLGIANTDRWRNYATIATVSVGAAFAIALLFLTRSNLPKDRATST
jgi:hypothetical protein